MSKRRESPESEFNPTKRIRPNENFPRFPNDDYYYQSRYPSSGGYSSYDSGYNPRYKRKQPHLSVTLLITNEETKEKCCIPINNYDRDFLAKDYGQLNFISLRQDVEEILETRRRLNEPVIPLCMVCRQTKMKKMGTICKECQKKFNLEFEKEEEEEDEKKEDEECVCPLDCKAKNHKKVEDYYE